MTEKPGKPTGAEQGYPDGTIRWLREALDLAEADTPFPWQEELFKRFAKGMIGRSLDIPNRSIRWRRMKTVSLLLVSAVTPLDGLRLRLVLTDGSVVERDVTSLAVGTVFEPVRDHRELFQSARAEHGSVVWPNGADLCPDVLIWNGSPQEGVAPAATLALDAPDSEIVAR